MLAFFVANLTRKRFEEKFGTCKFSLAVSQVGSLGTDTSYSNLGPDILTKQDASNAKDIAMYRCNVPL